MRAGLIPPLIQTLREQLPRLDPVQIGSSGQVKEFREERKYGEIGESHHRHISHLVGLYPGSCITRETPEWMAAAKVTLNRRGDKSTGWAMAHRINLWARTGEGNRAHKLYGDLLRFGTLPNLWIHIPLPNRRQLRRHGRCGRNAPAKPCRRH